MNKFKTFLAEKGITEDAWKSKSPEEMAALYSEFNQKLIADLEAKIEKGAKKEDIPNMEEALKGVATKEEIAKITTSLQEQGEVLTELKEKGGKSEQKTLAEQIKEKKETLKNIAKGSKDEVVVKADTLRASISSNTQATELSDIGQLAHRKLTLWNLFNKIPLSETNNNGTIKYWDWDSATTVRAAAAVAEGAAFPEDTAKWAEYTMPLRKIGTTLPISEEFFEDEAMFAGELNMFLETSVDIKVDTDLANADGTGNNIKGIVPTVNAYTPVASGITDASIYDLMVKVSESITSVGGSKYAPNFALMNISDINKMKLKKDANNNYIIPPFVSRDGSQIDSIVVIECNAITANSMVLGDSRYARIYYKPGVLLSTGYGDGQFVSDMMTLKARKRLAFLIRNADLGGFAKVTSISAALTTLAT